MNLSKLFEMQKKLDERIVREKGLRDEDLLDRKILALQVELGELANEWRGFKFWSEDQEPRTEVIVKYYSGGPTEIENWLLEEYVDCLHFILSIGNELNIEQWDYDYTFKDDLMELNDITEQFIMIIGGARKLYYDIAYKEEMQGDGMVSEFELEFRVWKSYRFIIGPFLSLGKMLGFTWEQIEQAYYEKNKINHERQVSGY